ncbi:MAG: flagellin [Candidatus Thermoplasmatota archaeon]|nr:flagellin [Candidatus Thermoplasmatota archaeon]
MGKIWDIITNKQPGAIGIGAMIVFIAMVLVAGIAAAVFIQTANTIEVRAVKTGTETRNEVATGIRVVDIGGKVSNSNITNITITVKGRAGAGDINLARTVIEISDGSKKVLLKYYTSDANHFNSTLDEDGQVFGTSSWSQNASQYGIIVLEDVDGSVTQTSPVINRGDAVMITVSTNACFGGLARRTEIHGVVLPEEGSPGTFAFRTPSLFTDTVYDLW